MALGVEVGFVVVANGNSVTEKKLSQWLTPRGGCVDDACGKLDLVAAEANSEVSLALGGGVGNDKAMMRDEAEADEARRAVVPSNRDSLGDSLKLGWSKRARGKHLAERMLFKANG